MKEIKATEDFTILPKQTSIVSTDMEELTYNYTSVPELASKKGLFPIGVTQEKKLILYNGGSSNVKIHKDDIIALIYEG